MSTYCSSFIALDVTYVARSGKGPDTGKLPAYCVKAPGAPSPSARTKLASERCQPASRIRVRYRCVQPLALAMILAGLTRVPSVPMASSTTATSPV